jgi:hypothetical protein
MRKANRDLKYLFTKFVYADGDDKLSFIVRSLCEKRIFLCKKFPLNHMAWSKKGETAKVRENIAFNIKNQSIDFFGKTSNITTKE